jgi:hypothetical protein
MSNRHQAEIDRNYEVFMSMLPQLEDKAGKFALMRDGKIINFYDTLADAYSTGQSIYSDGLFSIQKVTNRPVDLGFLSHAMHIG